MSNDTPASKLEKLRQRREKLNAEIARAEKAERDRQRAQDTRRKIVLGAALLSELEQDPALRAQVRGILSRRLTQERDRALLADLLAEGQ